MLTNSGLLLALVLLIAGCLWLARRCLRLRNPGARWVLATLAALPALLLLLLIGLIGVGYLKLSATQPAAAVQLDTAATPARIARGEHLARTTCVACHASNNQLPLSGGIDLSAHLPLPIGVVVPPNLTPAGPLKDWTDQQIVEAIRNGRDKTGRMLMAMPTAALRNLSDEDVAALVAFLRSQPAVPNDTPPVTPSLLLFGFVGAGMVDLRVPPQAGTVTAPPRQADQTYGAYVLRYQDCKSCHGPDLNGSSGGLGPATPSVRAVLRAWTLDQFISAMRTGVDPAGHAIQEPMPWQMLGSMDDTELTALYHYLRNLPPGSDF